MARGKVNAGASHRVSPPTNGISPIRTTAPAITAAFTPATLAFSSMATSRAYTAGCPVGEYMNSGLRLIIAGEIAKAAYDHGAEAYATDILERVWKLRHRDGGNLHQESSS
jgi:hypothetical protein